MANDDQYGNDGMQVPPTPGVPGPSGVAGVPTPNLPPLPPSVSQAAPAPPSANSTMAPPAPMQVDSFNQQRTDHGRGMGGFNPRFLLVPIVVVLGLIGVWNARGTTGAADLKAGDCFIMPSADEEEFTRLDTEDCSMPHDGQIFASIDIAGPDTYPDEMNAYWGEVFETCWNRFQAEGTRLAEIPEDAEVFFFSPVAQGWRQGDRESLCYLYAPSGLSGSHFG